MLNKIIFYISIAILAYILAVCVNSTDPDLWARLAVGSIFFQTGGLLKQDIFAYTPTKSLWIDHEWGSSVIFYFFVKYFGIVGLLFLKAVLIFGILLIIAKIIQLYQNKIDNIGVIYFIFIAFSLSPGLASPVRCQLFTYFFFALWIYLLERIRRGENRLLWLFPATMLLWANLHGGFISGIGLVVIYLTGEFLNKSLPNKKSLNSHPEFISGSQDLVRSGSEEKLKWLRNGQRACESLLRTAGTGSFLQLILAIPKQVRNDATILNCWIGSKKNPVKYLGILVSSLAVTLINPYGIKYWNYIIEATTMHRPWINEWNPLTLHEPTNLILGIPVNIFAGFIILAVLTILVAVWHAYKKTKPDWVKIILFTTLIYIGIAHKRNTMFLIIAASGMLYKDYLSLLYKFCKFRSLNTLGNIINYACFTLLAIHTCFLYPRLIVNPFHYPVGSVQFLYQNNISGNVLTTYRWGNYILWKLYPKCKVSIDGRYEEVYTSDVFDFIMTFNKRVGKNWADVPNKYHTDIIIAPKEFHTRNDLGNLKNWTIVYEDNISYLLLPKNKAKKSYIMPDANNKIYHLEDLSKPVDLNS